jgi:hypothetical protein
MRLFTFALLVLSAGGCALVPSSGSGLTERALVGTTWAEVCPNSDPERSFIRLDADATFAWSYEAPSRVEIDSGESWSVADGVLTISWNDGFATSRYDLEAGTAERIPGVVSSKNCGEPFFLERAEPDA